MQIASGCLVANADETATHTDALDGANTDVGETTLSGFRHCALHVTAIYLCLHRGRNRTLNLALVASEAVTDIAANLADTVGLEFTTDGYSGGIVSLSVDTVTIAILQL